MSAPLRLAVGPLAFDLVGLDLGLAMGVRARYRTFLVEEPASKPFELTLSVLPEDAPHRPPDVPAITRLGPRRFAFAYGSLEGELDLEARRGHATVIPTVLLVDSLLRITTTLWALEEDALLLHSCGVWLPGGRPRGEVLVAFGPSGVGKTTTARSVAPADVLCDEMMLLQALPDGRVLAHGTPFHGELPVTNPGTGEARALVRLVQAPAEKLARLSSVQAARQLLGSVLFFSSDAALADRLLGLALRIGQGRTYTLEFTRDTHVPRLVDGTVGRHAAAPHA